jgi:site-specific recombinase XerC
VVLGDLARDLGAVRRSGRWPVATRAGIQAHPHLLRHSLASAMEAARSPPA